ncbi:uncharacterized protein TrAtP1_010318 [Trichoderma atroviride]|uniref:uncharacterized protein n=1 Tax=Hypocrea atroviridis TaxID=63577 RepID=UPI003326E029|nr:hypothetical protein TrAtP1_010318 [Trichoderma atroviride]
MNVSIEKFHAQYKKQGVLCISICLGAVETGHFKNTTPEQMAKAEGIFQKFLAYSPQFKGPSIPEADIKEVISV